jgi:hypothetical protein
VVEVKEKESNHDLEYDPENSENIQIIEADPFATVTTATIQPKELVDPEVEECLFHSHMWVKGTPLHFVVDNDK